MVALRTTLALLAHNDGSVHLLEDLHRARTQIELAHRARLHRDLLPDPHLQVLRVAHLHEVQLEGHAALGDVEDRLHVAGRVHVSGDADDIQPGGGFGVCGQMDLIDEVEALDLLHRRGGPRKHRDGVHFRSRSAAAESEKAGGCDHRGGDDDGYVTRRWSHGVIICSLTQVDTTARPWDVFRFSGLLQ